MKDVMRERKLPADPGFPIVGVGASAGGLEAYTELLKHLPPDTGMGFVLVQHLDPEHESALTDLLSRATRMPVREVTQNLRVKPNRVYVIPPNTQLSIVRGVLKLMPRTKARVPHHPINYFFESLSQDRHERAIGVVLSGTASDGTVGLEAIKAEGGITFAQDASARYDSMPRSAAAAGCTDFVLSPQQIAQELTRIARHPYVAGPAAEAGSPDRSPEKDREQATLHSNDAKALPSGGHGSPHTGSRQARAEAAESATKGDQDYKKILLLLRNHSGVDFSMYKSSTIQRRINRRVLLSKHLDLTGYGAFLRGNTAELNALYSDVLISVTSFFRNPEAFDVLQQKAFPTLLKQRDDKPLRAWVLGCSTGQEAYSIAMSFIESSSKMARARKLQIFATDLNEALLDKARHGLYAKALEQDISPERLQRFFVEEEGGYRIIKPLREMVVFARQNLIADPPFSRMDLISCRNLLIYLDPSLQKKALPTFHYALKPGGFLFLGASESVSGFTELFEPLDKKHKLFFKKAAPAAGFQLPVKKDPGKRAAPGSKPPSRPALKRPPLEALSGPLEGFRGGLSAQHEADRISVNQFAPPSVLINEELQILQFRGPTGAYLQPPAGKASFDLLKMAREGLMLPLRAAIAQAKKENKTARRERVRISQDGTTRLVNLEIIPLKNLRERCFLVLFENAKAGENTGRAAPPPEPPRRAAGKRTEQRRVKELEGDLAENREYVQSLQEQHEAANEELQASSEEVQSANEELQSVNEELETSKEELESANEELTTVNDEMANRNAELSRLNNDLTNLQTSTQLAILLLGRDLSVRRFSVQAGKQFKLLAADLGRPIGNVRHNLVLPGLEAMVREVISSIRETEIEVQDTAGRWYLLRVRPYLTDENKVDGAVLVLVDITEGKRIEQALRHSHNRFEALFDASPIGIYLVDAKFRIRQVNRNALPVFGDLGPLIGRDFDEVIHILWPKAYADEIVQRFRHTLETGESYLVPERVEQRLDRHVIEHYSWQIFRIPMPDDSHGVVCYFQDVSERMRLASELREHAEELAQTARRKDEFLATMAHELRGPLAPLSNALELLRRSDGDNENTRQARGVAQRQVEHLVRLVDDLLDASRINSGKLTLRRQRIELAPVVRQAMETCRPAMDCVRHEVTVTLPSEPLYLNADPVRLAQVFSNLLTNACKYTEPGGRISLTAERHGSEAVISIKDNGIGIAPEMLPKLFGMFVQMDSVVDRAQGGLGIGLALVQRLITLHGGTVEGRSEGENKGCEFVVRLPLSEGIRGDKSILDLSSGPGDAPATKRSILVVDDNRDSVKTLAMVLTHSGHQTQIAYDGEEAMAAAEKFRPEIVLLDLGMPKLNGFEAARKIRQQPWGKAMVLIALTGWGQDEDRRKSAEAGFDAHLVKPLDHTALFKLLAELPAKKPVP